MKAFLLALFCCASSRAENLGTLSVSDVLLRPNFTLNHPGNAGFGVGESSIAVQWSLNESYSGHVRVGTRDLVNEPARYVSDANLSPDIMLVEAYAQYAHPYGRFRLGRQSLDFGIEGSKSEANLIFPRSFLYQKRVVGLRDIGLGYQVDYNNFFTTVVLHNGEGDTDRDGRLWYTGKWGYHLERAQVGISGQTGRTTPASTLNSSDTLGGVDPSSDAHWRMGGLFGQWTPPRFSLELEAYMGEVTQTHSSGRFATGHADVGYEWTDWFSTYARCDIFDNNLRKDGDAVRQFAGALVFTNASRSSRFILVGAYNALEGHTDTNEFRLIWSLSPSQLPSSF